MNYIELYKEQLNDLSKGNEVYECELFQEYFALNCYLHDVEITNERITDIICQEIQLLNQDTLKKINDSVEIIKNKIEDLYESNHTLLNDYHIDGIVFLLGDATLDSHGILLKDKAYVIVDLRAYAASIDKYNPTSFLVHEISHAIHYKINPNMYFKNFKYSYENIVKRILVEGMATYLSRVLTQESDTDVFWLGYLNEIGVSLWLEHAIEVKYSYSDSIKSMLESKKREDITQYELFSITNPDKLWEGRLAYYYGYEIVKKLAEDQSVEDIFKLKYEDYLEVLKDYFKI